MSARDRASSPEVAGAGLAVVVTGTVVDSLTSDVVTTGFVDMDVVAGTGGSIPETRVTARLSKAVISPISHPTNESLMTIADCKGRMAGREESVSRSRLTPDGYVRGTGRPVDPVAGHQIQHQLCFRWVCRIRRVSRNRRTQP